MKTHKPTPTQTALALGLAASLLPWSLQAGFSAPGHGLTNVVSGSVPNAGLYWQTSTNWINGAGPAKPYVLTNSFALPVCDAIPVARLVTTVWGGTANYSSEFTVSVNGTNLPAANPLVFGTTADISAVFSAATANAYGSGSGVWLVTLPVPGEMLFKDGATNSVVITETTPDSFDGRVHHVTLLAVYQNSTLENQFDYAVAEGSGDIYRAPTAVQTSQRTFEMPGNPTNATAATLTALYTYGDLGQNDRLYFNQVPLGGDDVAGWDKVGTGLDFGPSVVSFDVLANLAATNWVKFTVLAGEAPDTRESSVRPQLVVLAVTRTPSPPAIAPVLSATVQDNHLDLTVSGEVGRTYVVLSSTNLNTWSEEATFVSTNAISHWSCPAEKSRQFLRVRTP